jgi:LysM repeat protein
MRAITYKSIRLLSVVLALAALAGLSPLPRARADSVIHIVQPGENLFRIGLKYGLGWQAIMQANGLASTYIYVGQELIIPVEGASVISAPPAEPTPAPAPAAPAGAEQSFHVVQAGETLFRIATRFGLSTWQLAAANHITNPALIYPGQTLLIPGGANPAAVPPPSSASGKRIRIDISEQHLYAYENGALIFSFVASTGAPGMNTRPGSYQVQSKIPNAYGGNWNIWMPNWLGIYWAGPLENGIHALPILPGGGRLWEGYLGTPVSYGCIILGVHESQQLYDWAELGVPVEIQY